MDKITVTKNECLIVLLISLTITTICYSYNANKDIYAADDNIVSETSTLVPIEDIEHNQNTGAPVIELPEPVVEEEKSTAYYSLTDEERELVERVVMGESGDQDYDGQRLVAQCILNGCVLENMRPDELVIEYGYTKNRPEPSESVKQAVAAVFDNYDVVTEENILVFYAPRWCTSEWHESQQFVLEHGDHRFFTFNT